MRYTALLFMLLGPVLAKAQTADELDIFAAMIDAPDGTPLATATAVAGEPGNLVFVTGAKVAQATNSCLRVWDQGACFPIGNATPLPGYDDFVLITVNVPQEEMNRKFSTIRMTRQPLVGTYDAGTGDGLTFATQNALGGWERPVSPAMPSGQSLGQTVLRSDAFTSLSIGAPLVHPKDGLVGLVSRTAQGSALMLPIREALLASQATGLEIADWMLPDAPEDGDLPPRVASEIGRMIIFSDYSSIGYLGGFYGPSQGSGFDETFVTTVDFSVWEIDLSGPRGSLVTRGDRTIPLVPTGMPMEAPFTGRPGDHLATCTIHATPSSGRQPVFVVQFWRSVPERYNPNDDGKDYDQAAPPMIGWAGQETCATAIATMGADRLAALSNADVLPSDTEASQSSASNTAQSQDLVQTQPQAEWRRTELWQATGREALFRDLTQGRLLTVGCTDSRELAIAVSPGSDILKINDLDVRRADPDVGYVLLSGDIPQALKIEMSGATETVPMTSDLLGCSPS